MADAWHARVGADDMVNHAYLTEDGLVEQTEFSSGLALMANYADQPRSVDGVDIDAGAYKVRE